LRYVADRFIRVAKRDILQLITVCVRAANIRVSMLFDHYKVNYRLSVVETFC